MRFVRNKWQAPDSRLTKVWKKKKKKIQQVVSCLIRSAFAAVSSFQLIPRVTADCASADAARVNGSVAGSPPVSISQDSLPFCCYCVVVVCVCCLFVVLEAFCTDWKLVQFWNSVPYFPIGNGTFKNSNQPNVLYQTNTTQKKMIDYSRMK